LYGNARDKKPKENGGKHGIKIRAGYKKAVDSWKLAKRKQKQQRAESRRQNAESREQRSRSS
jgi:hypothetical protein